MPAARPSAALLMYLPSCFNQQNWNEPHMQMIDAVKLAEQKMGPVDVLVPNAGIASGGKKRCWGIWEDRREPRD